LVTAVVEVSEKRRIVDSLRLDIPNECLWRGSQVIKLRPKAFAVLNHLVARRGQLVTKEDLLSAAWPGTFVTDTVIKVAIRQLREALDDDPKSPRFIETSHRRGYRFVGQLSESGTLVEADQISGINAASSFSLRSAASLVKVVGRDDALSQMQSCLGKMLSGQRQIVFVTGEAGIGKTALVDTFAGSLGSDGRIRIGRGQCLEQYGTSEAYLPVLEAIGRLCRQDGHVTDVLRAHAPMWLLQMPSLVTASDRESLRQQVLGPTRERMLREIGEALEVLTENQSLVLILEDLHWSDYSTLDLITYLARQRQPAHLMLIGTNRTVELIVSGHPLKAIKQELLAKQQCEELPLEYLDAKEVSEYLTARFPVNRFPVDLAGLIQERTDGNPLFMVNAVDYLVTQGSIVEQDGCWKLEAEIEKVEVGVPDTIKQMIEKQIDHLDAGKQRTLEAASVAGAEFSTLAVVAGLGEDRATVEALCDELARQRQFIQDRGVRVLPNGEAVPRYGFIHALYRSMLYERVSASRRAQMHRRIGERGEEIYGERAREIATGLAWHFEQSRDYNRAAKYLHQAAENAIRRFAYREAVGLSRRGLELLQKLPDTPERAAQELSLQLTMGVPLVLTEGYGAPEVGTAYLRARGLCRQLGETTDVSEVLWGLWAFYIVRAELETSLEIAQEFLGLAERLPLPGLAMRGHLTVGVTLLHRGEFVPAMEHFEKALSLPYPERHLNDSLLVQNPGVALRCYAAWALWFLGKPEQALYRMNEALTMAHELSEPNGLAHAYYFAGIVHHLRREEQLAQETAEATIAISSEHGLMWYQAMATITLGFALMEQGQSEEAIEQMLRGLAAHQATGAEVARPHFLALLAEGFAKAGNVEEGLQVMEQALGLAHRNGEGSYLPELYRVKGELLLMRPTTRGLSRGAAGGKVGVEVEPPGVPQAEECFHESIKIARQQKANSWELRAVMSLTRLYQSQGKQKEARSLLTQIYDKFTEGFDTVDLRQARTLLDELST
jgi:DNA-binding winged helix-turn-helix (wHTH) protein/predicted ATPase